MPSDVENTISASRKTAIVIRLHSETSMHLPGYTRIPTAGPREKQKQQHMKSPRSPTKELPQRERFNTIARPGLKVYAAPRRIPPISTPARGLFSVYNFFSMFINSSCTRKRVVRGLISRSLNQQPPHSFYSNYRLLFNIVET